MRLVVLLAMVFSLALAGTALAQDNPTEDAYGGVLGEEVSNSDDGTEVIQNSASNPPPPATVSQQGSDSGGSLPFTGLELGLVALAGFGLVTLGFVMRRSTRHNT